MCSKYIKLALIEENMKNKKQVLINFFKVSLPIVGPIVFEISNIVTGSWVENKEFNARKVVTILLAIAYIVITVYQSLMENKRKQNIEELKKQIEDLNSEKEQFVNTFNQMGNAISYSCKSLKTQAEVLRKNSNTEIRELSIVNFATTACTIWYTILTRKYGKEHITVNIYHKFRKSDAKEYETMIAHEGYITKPKYFGQERLLKVKKTSYYAEKILMKDNPEVVLLLTPETVAEAFNQSVERCKYKQYIAIPIIDKTGKTCLMVEINAIEKSVFPEDSGFIKEFLNLHFSWLKEYLLLMINLEDYAQIVDYKLTEGKIR